MDGTCPGDDGYGIGPVFCSSLSVILAATQIPVSSSSLDPSCYRSWAGLGSTFKQSTREHFLVLGLVALGSRAQESTRAQRRCWWTLLDLKWEASLQPKNHCAPQKRRPIQWKTYSLGKNHLCRKCTLHIATALRLHCNLRSCDTQTSLSAPQSPMQASARARLWSILLSTLSVY